MATNLMTKGGNVEIPKGVSKIFVGASWEAPHDGFDLDVWCFLLNKKGKVPTDDHLVFFNNLVFPGGSVCLSGDSLNGGNEKEDDEVATVNLGDIPQEIDRIAVVVNIYEGLRRGQNFGQLDNAAIRLFILDAEGQEQELTRYNLGIGDASTETSLIFGELYRRGSGWKFRAVAQGVKKSPWELARDYGVDVEIPAEDQAPLADASADVTPAEPRTTNSSKGEIKLDGIHSSTLIEPTREMEFSLYWTKSSKDLGLILLVTYRDGTKRSFDWRNLGQEGDEVFHHGDLKRGGTDTREYVTVRIGPNSKIAAFAIVGYSELDNSIGSFRSMGAHAVIDDGNGTRVTINLKKGGTFSYHVVLATVVVQDDGRFLVNRVSRFSTAGSEKRPEIDAQGKISMNTGPAVFKPGWSNW